MSCPLSDTGVEEVLSPLPGAFSTLDFIAACPHSGGRPDGGGCPSIRARGGRRAVCGKRLAEFAHGDQHRLEQTNPGSSPAEWIDHGKAGAGPSSESRAVPVPVPVPVPHASTPSSGHSSLYRLQVAHQIRWKEEVAGVREQGSAPNGPRAFLFPEARWEQNLLPQFRQDVLDHLAVCSIERHQFAHHVMSSQCFALNLAAPFFRNPAWLRPALGEGVAEVERVEAEVIGEQNYLGEPGMRGAKRTSADLGVWVRRTDGRRALHLIEVKFTEAGFGECTKGSKHGGACDTDGAAVVRSGGAMCPLAGPPYRRSYWRLMADLGVFNMDALARAGPCAFRHGGYQLMRNQVLAAAIEEDPAAGLAEVTFSLLLHDHNREIRTLAKPLGGTSDVASGWASVLSTPSRFGGIRSARAWVEAFRDHPHLASWAREMMGRYFPAFGSTPAEVDTRPRHTSSSPALVRAGHLRSARWMATDEFAAVKRLHDLVIGEGGVYFRPTGKGVVVIMLADDAPGYVGFRTSHDDEGHVLKPGAPMPGEADLRARLRAFHDWLPSVRRSSDEERAVIPWLRQSLRARLVLPGMGGEWIFLNQEWRFERGDGTGKKSDVLAVHVPSGRLGIVEAKDAVDKRDDATAQVREYARYWERDVGGLVPFFTEVLRAMGRLYDNAWAATGTVSALPAATFVAYPVSHGLFVERVD